MSNTLGNSAFEQTQEDKNPVRSVIFLGRCVTLTDHLGAHGLSKEAHWGQVALRIFFFLRKIFFFLRLESISGNVVYSMILMRILE